MKAYNMTSKRGNPVPNQFEISHDGNLYFKSYNSIIVKIDKYGKVWLDADTWNYSRTTARYRAMFLKESTKDTLDKIKKGVYILADLN